MNSPQVTKAPRPEIWGEIATKQAELQALYTEAGANIFKQTDGAAFLGEKNTAHSQYWHGVVKKHPTIVKGTFDTPDYGVKNELFPRYVEVYNGHNAAGAVLENPYDVLSQDTNRYSLDARKAFIESKDAVHKQIVKDAPPIRKPSSNNSKSKAEKESADKSTDTSKKD